ncbi:MAG TPA: C2H2-type zinc finger protein [Phycisphaerae bacterium]|nr:C2H2-type zinc finger protein [Phycisphaerae bacterium]
MAETTPATRVINLETVWDTCPTCGVPFGLLMRFDTARSKDHETFYCPNGHEMSYPEKDERDESEVKEENRRLKAKVMKLTMDLDQAQAKARDAEEKLSAYLLAEAPAGSDKEAASYKCKVCGKEYKRRGALSSHIIDVHGATPARAC